MVPVEVAAMVEGLSGAVVLAGGYVAARVARRNTRLDARRRHGVDRPGGVTARAVVGRLLRERGAPVSHRAVRRRLVAPPTVPPRSVRAPLELTAAPAPAPPTELVEATA